jgi:hypothetical protein
MKRFNKLHKTTNKSKMKLNNTYKEEKASIKIRVFTLNYLNKLIKLKNKEIKRNLIEIQMKIYLRLSKIFRIQQ